MNTPYPTTAGGAASTAVYAVLKNSLRAGLCSRPMRDQIHNAGYPTTQQSDSSAQVIASPRPQLGHQPGKYRATRSKRKRKANTELASENRPAAKMASLVRRLAAAARQPRSHTSPTV